MSHGVTSAAPETWTPPAHLGARLGPDGDCAFRVWAPHAGTVRVSLDQGARVVPLSPRARGYHEAVIRDVADGARYTLLLDDAAGLPDPASRAQPDGVHGTSQVVGTEFPWTDGGWRGTTLVDCVLYELHVGTFTRDGTFDAVIPRLPELRDLGVTAIELMPVAEFPGSRNWGYDGVFPFAVQSSYGGPRALKRLVDAAHAEGIAVVLDVVYNHLGPEGNYLPRFGPYFTDRYRTPWGDALNFDGPGSDEVRAFFIASALQWIDEFHMDGLRLDAVHAIIDHSARPFLLELADTVRARSAASGREALLIAESDLADPRMIRPPEQGGLHMHAQWLDDFHHALHTLLTGERQGYYEDYGSLEHMARAWRSGYVYAGEFSRFRGRRHGVPAAGATPSQFVVFAQNHDQVGNRLAGERLSTLVDDAALRLAAATTLLAPFVPLLFMGEEYGERAPFPYFVSHTDPALVAAVRRGRREEFAAFDWEHEPPDPQAEATFRSAVLDWEQRARAPHAALLALHRELLDLRRTQRLLTRFRTCDVSVLEPLTGPAVLSVLRADGAAALLLLLNFALEPAVLSLPAGRWSVLFDTTAALRHGPRPLAGTIELPASSALLCASESS